MSISAREPREATQAGPGRRAGSAQCAHAVDLSVGAAGPASGRLEKSGGTG